MWLVFAYMKESYFYYFPSYHLRRLPYSSVRIICAFSRKLCSTPLCLVTS